MAGKICIDLKDCHRYESCGTWRLDLSVCKLNAAKSKSILEWIDNHCIGSVGAVFAQLQEESVKV